MSYTIKFLILISCLFSLQTLVNGDGEEEILQLFVFPAVINSTKISEKCRNDTEVYKQALLEAEAWAVQMYDASSKIPSGVLYGNYMHLGNFDQCIAVKSDDELITGKACIPLLEVSFLKKSLIVNPTSYISDFMETALVNYKTKSRLIKIPMKWLWCVPSSCQVNDIRETITEIFGDTEYQGSAMIQVIMEENSCTTAIDTSQVPDFLDYSYFSLLIAILVLIIISTAYEYKKKNSGTNPSSTQDIVCTSFSIFTNCRELFSLTTHSDDLHSLYAIRFLSLCFVIYFNVLTQYFVSSPTDITDFIYGMNSFTGQLISNFILAIDIFFLLPGFVVAYNETARAARRPFEYATSWLWALKFYFQRWITLTPCYMMIVGFYATCFYFIGNGPIWNEYAMEMRKATREDWWYHVLYIANVGYTSRALPQMWYLTLLMQMYILAPAFLYTLIVIGPERTLTQVVYGVAFFLSIASAFGLTYNRQIPAVNNIFRVPEVIEDQLGTEINNLYICEGLYVRIGSFLLGMLLGYYLKHVNKNPEWYPVTRCIMWFFVIMGYLFIIFAGNGLRRYDPDYDRFHVAVYSGVHRLVFAMAVGWLVLTTEAGCNGKLGDLLMWPGWKPLGRLTFCMYLTHYFSIFYTIGTMRNPPSLRNWDMMMDFFGHLGFSFILAFILCISVEMPIARLVKYFTKILVASDEPDAPIVRGRRSKAVKEI